MTRLMHTHTHGALLARIRWMAIASAAIAAGLASRMWGDALPSFVATYAGDTLWATAVFAIAGAIAPNSRLRSRAVGSLAFAFAIECSQLLRFPWLESLRATMPGALVLGRGFLWSDLACYAAGVALPALGETLVRFARTERTN